MSNTIPFVYAPILFLLFFIHPKANQVDEQFLDNTTFVMLSKFVISDATIRGHHIYYLFFLGFHPGFLDFSRRVKKISLLENVFYWLLKISTSFVVSG
jgi:hypothetical protein